MRFFLKLENPRHFLKYREANVKALIYCHFSLKNACSSSKCGLFFTSSRIDMIQSAFDRFTRILSSGAVYEALICIIEKNGAIFAILLHHFWMKISKKIEKLAISRKVGPFFILWLHGPHDRIFQRLWAQWTHPQLGGAYNTFHIHKWRHFSSNCLNF